MATRLDKKTRKLGDRFVVPAIPQFIAAVSDEILLLQGARKCASLLNRLQRNGAWKETIAVPTASKLKDGSVAYGTKKAGKQEHELNTLLKMKEAGLRLSDNDDVRIEEISNLLPANLAKKSDDELATIMTQWIENQRADRTLPEPLPESAYEAYELSLKPRAGALPNPDAK